MPSGTPPTGLTTHAASLLSERIESQERHGVVWRGGPGTLPLQTCGGDRRMRSQPAALYCRRTASGEVLEEFSDSNGKATLRCLNPNPASTFSGLVLS